MSLFHSVRIWLGSLARNSRNKLFHLFNFHLVMLLSHTERNTLFATLSNPFFLSFSLFVSLRSYIYQVVRISKPLLRPRRAIQCRSRYILPFSTSITHVCYSKKKGVVPRHVGFFLCDFSHGPFSNTAIVDQSHQPRFPPGRKQENMEKTNALKYQNSKRVAWP